MPDPTKHDTWNGAQKLNPRRPKPLYNLTRLAEHLGRSRRWVFELVEAGVLPRPRYQIDGIRAWDELQLEAIMRNAYVRKRVLGEGAQK